MGRSRKILSLLLVLSGCMALGLAAAAYAARYIGEAGHVSQVFKKVQSVPLGPGNQLGWYEAAVTPSAPDQTAVLCHILAFSDDDSLNLIEKKVWLIPHEPIPYAFYENTHSRNLMLVLLGAGLLLMVLSVPLYPPK